MTLKNIFDDSDDDYSVITAVSNRRLSRPIMDVEENDDQQEKKAKRKSILLMPSTSQKSDLVSGLTQEQIGSHYGNCMKLASENKINSKNAFNLHLIEFLSGYVKDLEHFQQIGSTLDAGTKIYAGRVDSTYLNTYQVLTGLGNTNEAPQEELPGQEEDTPVDPILSDEEQENKTKKNKRKFNPNKNTICQNLTKIRINPTQIRSDVDPLFQSQAENYDEGGSCELRCNNLRLLDKTFALLLDSESIVYTHKPQETINEVDEFSDVTLYDSNFESIRNFQTILSGQFEDFMFTGWNQNCATMNSTTAESFKIMIDEAKKMEDAMDIDTPIDDDYMDEDNGFGDDFANNDHANFSQIMKDEHQEEEDDNLVVIGNSKAENDNGNILMSSVKDIVNSMVEHYGEMNLSLLGMWAGPQNWKQKSKPIRNPRIIPEKKPNHVPKPVKELIPIFPSKIETRLNEDGIGRMVIPDNWGFVKANNLSTQLTDSVLNKNINKDYLLPPRTNFNMKVINQLMNREISVVNQILKNHINSIASMTNLDDDKTIIGNNINNDVIEIGPKPLIADDEGNVTMYNQDFADGFDNDDEDYQPYTGNSFHNDEFANEDEDVGETANVRHIEQIDIDYAKSAKRINVKKIKHEISEILTAKIQMIDIQTVKEQKFPNLHKTSQSIKFSELLQQVDNKLPNDDAKDLSVSILLTCLLHLSNEKGLDLSNDIDFSDLIISQGYSDYDIEQINRFGDSFSDQKSKVHKNSFFRDESDDQ